MTNELTTWQGGEIQAAAISPDLYNRFLKFVETKPQSVETYRRALKPFFMYLMEKGITQPKRADLLAYRAGLMARVDAGTLSAATVRLYIAAVRRFFTWTEQEDIYRDISRGLKGAQVAPGYKKMDLAINEVEKVLGSIDRATEAGRRDYAIIRLMTTTGLRTIEVANANIEDLATMKGGQTILYVRGKGRDDRAEFVKVGGHTEAAIRSYLEARPTATGKDPLFASDSNRNRGGRMTTKSISRIAKNSLRAAGYDSAKLTAHSFRHTAGTQAIENGLSLHQVQIGLRHRDPKTTEIYIHSAERARNNMEIILDGLYTYEEGVISL